MATVNKDFKIKGGLVVGGTTGTINNQTILTEVDGDAYILDLIGGETLITSVDADDFTVTGGELTIAAGSDIARDGDITSAINALTTSDIEEGTNQYFTNQRALDATSAAYDTAGSASDVASDLTDHENATEAHGATGAVVGTTNTQSLSNKTISYVDNTLTVQVANVSDLTASASELNTLDGITASTAELNLLDGVTATTAELNYLDGVTSGIQGQLNDKAPLASPSLTGTPLAPTATPGTNSTQIATTAYADAAVAALVDGAPELLNTLNELAAAINDDETFATTVAGLVADKQDILIAGSNIDITGDTISVTGLASTDISDFNTAALSATAAAYDVAGAASDVQDNLDTHTDATSGVHGVTGNVVGTSDSQTLTNKTIDGSSNTISNIANASLVNDSITINGSATALGGSVTLGTDDISEGANNLYYTNSRAKAEAAALLTNATKTNIQITADGSNNLTITAENGVDDSTTDDLDEGLTRLYFTDQRAVDALEAVVPDFTAVEINSLAKQIAATISAPTGGAAVTAYSFAKADYRSAKFLIKTAYGTHTELTEVLLTLDSSDNIAIVEYATVGTNGSSMTVTADVDGSNVRLRVTPTNNTSTVNVVGTLLA
jgi:hypothetical protein